MYWWIFWTPLDYLRHKKTAKHRHQGKNKPSVFKKQSATRVAGAEWNGGGGGGEWWGGRGNDNRRWVRNAESGESCAFTLWDIGDSSPSFEQYRRWSYISFKNISSVSVLRTDWSGPRIEAGKLGERLLRGFTWEMTMAWVRMRAAEVVKNAGILDIFLSCSQGLLRKI